MPIYSYRCENCGHQQDVLQKMSDPLLVTCPACEQPTYRKQVTAAGFQLKGSGWYVTDFRNPTAKEGTKGAPKEADAGGAKESAATGESSGGSDASKLEKNASPSPAKSEAAPAPAAAPKPASSGGDSGGTG